MTDVGILTLVWAVLMIGVIGVFAWAVVSAPKGGGGDEPASHAS